MLNRATETVLDKLHSMTAETIMAEIEKYKRGEVLDPKTGNALPLPPALLAQAIKFLADNGIDQPLVEGSAVDKLAKRLPQLTALDECGLPN